MRRELTEMGKNYRKYSLTLALMMIMASQANLANATYAGDKPLSFSYQVIGAPTAKPLQVFSDGEQMFIEFKNGVKPSEVFIKERKGDPGYVKVAPEESAPYFRINGDPEEVSIIAEVPDLTVSAFITKSAKKKVTKEKITIKRTRVMAELVPPIVPVVIDPAEEKAKEIEAKLKMLQEEESRMAEAVNNDIQPVSDPSYPIGVQQQPITKDKAETNKSVAKAPVVVEQDQWELIKPSGEVQPLVDWKFEKNKHAVLLTLQKGKGYEIVSAKDKDGLNHYKGKVNGAHEITLPYMSDDRIDIEVSDMKSNKYFYQFKPSADIYRAEPVTESKSQNLEPAQKTEVAEVTNEQPKVVEVEPKKPEIYQFALKPGQYLSNELSYFLKKNFNWGLIWNKRTDIQVNSELSTQITDIAQLATWLGEVANLKVMLDPQTNQLIILEN
jgi:hypothetical protein